MELNNIYGEVIFAADVGTVNALVAAALASNTSLQDADLHDADLRDADLQDADLRGANLQCADLRDADLQDADLRGANLQCADLRGADLQDADLQGADLLGADLRGANLRDANLRDANLRGANLRGADLQGADLQDAPLPHFQHIPPTGPFWAWKKASRGAIVKLLIPEDALRSHSTGRKCRASKAVVLEILLDGRPIDSVRLQHSESFEYRVGETVTPTEPFCEDRWNECAPGIHFFLTREEAEECQHV